MIMSGSPVAARCPAARTTRVDLPAPGGESTTTPRCRGRSASTASTTAEASAPGEVPSELIGPSLVHGRRAAVPLAAGRSAAGESGDGSSSPLLIRLVLGGDVLRWRAAVRPRRLLGGRQARRRLELVG